VAIALTNLGVLKALTGRISAARDDFLHALQLQPALQPAETNLRRLATAGHTTA
jgi:Flp pilus assembly protein TadD